MRVGVEAMRGEVTGVKSQLDSIALLLRDLTNKLPVTGTPVAAPTTTHTQTPATAEEPVRAPPADVAIAATVSGSNPVAPTSDAAQPTPAPSTKVAAPATATTVVATTPAPSTPVPGRPGARTLASFGPAFVPASLAPPSPSPGQLQQIGTGAWRTMVKGGKAVVLEDPLLHIGGPSKDLRETYAAVSATPPTVIVADTSGSSHSGSLKGGPPPKLTLLTGSVNAVTYAMHLHNYIQQLSRYSKANTAFQPAGDGGIVAWMVDGIRFGDKEVKEQFVRMVGALNPGLPTDTTIPDPAQSIAALFRQQFLSPLDTHNIYDRLLEYTKQATSSAVTTPMADTLTALRLVGQQGPTALIIEVDKLLDILTKADARRVEFTEPAGSHVFHNQFTTSKLGVTNPSLTRVLSAIAAITFQLAPQTLQTLSACIALLEVLKAIVEGQLPVWWMEPTTGLPREGMSVGQLASAGCTDQTLFTAIMGTSADYPAQLGAWIARGKSTASVAAAAAGVTATGKLDECFLCKTLWNKPGVRYVKSGPGVKDAHDKSTHHPKAKRDSRTGTWSEEGSKQSATPSLAILAAQLMDDPPAAPAGKPAAAAAASTPKTGVQNPCTPCKHKGVIVPWTKEHGAACPNRAKTTSFAASTDEIK